MDGTLYDTEELFISSYLGEVSRVTGLTFDRSDLLELVGLNAKACHELFIEMFGTAYTYEQCQEISIRWMRQYLDEKGMPIKEGVIPLLKHLKELGVKNALATSSHSEVAAHYLELSELGGYFDVVIGGDMIKNGKPNPDIFLEAAGKLGCKDLSSCVVFEDSANGLLAAHNAEIPCIVIPDVMDPTVKYPGLCFKKFDIISEAIPLFEQPC